jgi:CubicO group peptidase (beta-lactamase class C family)
LLAQPGERWLYNTGASVLGVLLARAAGEPLGDVLRSRIFAPLGMRDTAFFTTATSWLATAYRPAPGGLVVQDEPDGAWSRPRHSATGRPTLSLPPVICRRSRGCCFAVARRCCRPAQSVP